MVAHDYFSKKVAPIQDVLSFLKARQVLAEGELSGQPSGLQITVEALAVVTSWAGPNQAANNFYELAKGKKLHPECLLAADRMVQRVLADELLYMPQCADPWNWQAGPDNCPNRNVVYYNLALACTFNPYQSKWFAPRYPKLNVAEHSRQVLSVGDYECSFGYLVLYCCALHLGL